MMKTTLITICFIGYSLAFMGNDQDPYKSPAPPKQLEFGDVVLTEAQKKAVKSGNDVGVSDANAFAGSNKAFHRWPNAVIPYEIDCSLENMPDALDATYKAMNEWQTKTCIRFVKRTNEKDYLQFFRNTHCWGNVGRIGGRSQISIGDGCQYQHVMVHEIGHAVGFWHEQNRMDRDTWIDIYWSNIEDWVKSAFEKVKDSDSFGVQYDYGSIMHYPWNAFSKNGKDTIKPKYRVRNQPYKVLSTLDAKQTSLMYNCPVVRKRRAAAAALKLPGEYSTFAGSCQDQSRYCGSWAKAGHCATNMGVLKKCPQSCKLPECDTSIPCVDKFAECPKWHSWGHCKTNPTVARDCARSCSTRCRGTTPSQKPPTQAPPPTSRPNGKKLGNGILCSDSHPDCVKWAAKGDCQTNRIWMNDRCKKSCRVKNCDQQPVKPPGSCADPVGISFDGKGWKIPDSAFFATSHLSPGGGWQASAQNARLYFIDDHNRKRIGAWCVDGWDKFKGSYLQIDLQRRRKLTYIATQGRDRYFERVSEYKIGYSDNGRDFTFYKENGKEKIFSGNCDHFTPILNRFNNPIYARHVRFYPIKANFPCVRLEFYGC